MRMNLENLSGFRVVNCLQFALIVCDPVARKKSDFPNPKVVYGVSENRGALFWGPYNKDPII